MLVIRLQRLGRRGTATYRVIVQDARWSPKRGKIVAHLGSYDPHTKAAVIDKEKTEHFLKHGAQPSERLAALLKKEGLKLPSWVPKPRVKKGQPRKKAEVTEKPAAKPEEAAAPAEAPAVADAEKPAEETTAESPEATNETAERAPDSAKAEESPAAESDAKAEQAAPEPEAPAATDEKPDEKA